MCQIQPHQFKKINGQIDLIYQLIQDIKFQLKFILIDKAMYSLAILKLQQIQGIINKIEYFDDLDFQLDSLSQIYNYRQYTQIIGIGQFSDQQSSIQSNQEHDQQTSKLHRNTRPRYQCTVRGPYRKYEDWEKTKVLQLRKVGKSYTFISKALGIPQKNIVRWCKYGIMRKEGAGRKIGDILMQKRVIQWLLSAYQQGQSIIGKQIRNKAKEYSTKQDFKSSKGWLKNFLNRYKLGQKYEIL